ncbi:c-type cytochrome [Rhodanobacter sp. AS-Z3]|uniref:c-type cytochrome n=1 Tax=Rhodanobacter sp. AS-Z3 TaxID=3031330 RepID=UPI00247A949B|nr:c-type cytochrome [Rhodanobacter sp. AS-Z3]WEN14509.1 c-type cytochrome [Rhodanobacter sp. AS-Z3]
MSCGVGGSSCETPRRRGAFVVLGILALVFVVLSIFSFLKSRGQVTPDTISFGQYQAADGKRVFQAYNCMGCHTMVGNGAYLGPDLTEEYKHAGPAWLAAFLPAAGGWPTKASVHAQLLDPNQLADLGSDSIDDYLKKFPGAAQRIERRGGGTSMMPNLPLTKDEIGQLIAYLKYTSAMNTEGWPPKVEVQGLDHRLQLAHGTMPAALAAAPAASPTAPTAADPAAHGAQLVKDNGCLACHAIDGKRLVGPGWGGLYNSKVSLADGSSVTADDAYLEESIRKPDAKVVAGYPASVMPAYASLLKDDEVNAIVAYLHTLEKQ